MAESQPPAVVTEVKHAEFAPSLTVVTGNNRKYDVSVNAVANRADMQILVAKLKKILDKTVEEYIKTDETLSPTDLGRLMGAAKSVADMSLLAYEAKDPKEGGAGMASYAEKLLEAAARGVSSGAQTSAERRRKMMADLGKKKDSVEIIATNVTPKPGDVMEVG